MLRRSTPIVRPSTPIAKLKPTLKGGKHVGMNLRLIALDRYMIYNYNYLLFFNIIVKSYDWGTDLYVFAYIY